MVSRDTFRTNNTYTYVCVYTFDAVSLIYIYYLKLYKYITYQSFYADLFVADNNT